MNTSLICGDSLSSLFSSNIFSLAVISALILTSLVLLIINISYLSSNKLFTAQIVARLTRVSHLINQIEACQIENISLIRNVIADEGYNLLLESFDIFVHDSQKLYQNQKWTLDPKLYINSNYLLSNSQYNSLHNAIAFKQLAIGLLISAFSLIIPLSLTVENSTKILPFSILPALISLAFFCLFYHKNANYRYEIENNMAKLAQTIMHRVPVYSSVVTSAMMVNAFVDYDKQMSKAVQRLSNSVSAMLSRDMVHAISDTVKLSLEESFGPAINESHQLLHDLSLQITERQEKSMAVLAETFTEQLGKTMASKLNPFYQQVNAYVVNLNMMSEELTKILSELSKIQVRNQEMDNKFNLHLQQLQAAQQNFLENTDKLSSCELKVVESCQELIKLQGTGEESLLSHVKHFSEQLAQFSASISKQLNQNADEADNNRAFVDRMINNQKKFMENYQSLTETNLSAGQALTRQADFINRQLEALSAQFQNTIGQFSQHMQNSVRQNLEIFDEGLAEINDRLSTSVSEIKQILPKESLNKDGEE